MQEPLGWLGGGRGGVAPDSRIPFACFAISSHPPTDDSRDIPRVYLLNAFKAACRDDALGIAFTCDRRNRFHIARFAIMKLYRAPEDRSAARLSDARYAESVYSADRLSVFNRCPLTAIILRCSATSSGTCFNAKSRR